MTKDYQRRMKYRIKQVAVDPRSLSAIETKDHNQESVYVGNPARETK